MLSETFTLKKSHLGWLLLVGSILSFVAIFSIDLIAIARENGVLSIFSAATVERLRGPLGVGPAQRLALFACLGLAAIGGTLIPLGDKPA
jgi:hypothetical protein